MQGGSPAKTASKGEENSNAVRNFSCAYYHWNGFEIESMGVGSTIRPGPADLRQVAWKFTLPRTRAALRKRRRPGLLVWWSVAIVALLLCVGLRGFADDVGFPVHGSEIESGVFGSPTLWLQQHIYSLWPWFFGWACAMVHASWFPVPWLAALLVSWRRPERIGSFFRWWIAL